VTDRQTTDHATEKWVATGEIACTRAISPKWNTYDTYPRTLDASLHEIVTKVLNQTEKRRQKYGTYYIRDIFYDNCSFTTTDEITHADEHSLASSSRHYFLQVTTYRNIEVQNKNMN